ncbi:uncharacterized protein LOC143262264 [Megalopta genalis]|uniref:uncharacterized protein LOC143262264 n=1 Tax=Megalopta genalis TaxID=115081 RepID=UPI003FD580B7
MASRATCVTYNDLVRRSLRGGRVTKCQTLLDLLLDLSQNGDALTDEDVRNEVNTFIFAGLDTTVTRVSWILYVLGPQRSISDNVTGTPEINKVGIRIPPFWHNNPTLWFAQVEGQFALNGITADTTKFYYITSNLDYRCMEEVQDIIGNPPETDKYKKIKDELIRRLSTSEEQRIHQLIEREEIGDRTPSQFLRHIRNLAGSTVTDKFLRTLFLNRLPASMRPILATQMDSPLDKMAELADKVKELNPSGQCSAVASSDTKFDILREQMTRLTQQVAELTKRTADATESRRSRDRRPARNGWRRRSRTRSPSQPGVCWYHRKFGDRATRCTTPCTHVSQQGNETDRP